MGSAPIATVPVQPTARTRFERWWRSSTEAIEPIVMAVERLAKRKIGALIAIERSAELGALADTGIRLDAIVSAELLETIFWPGTALHDLGVALDLQVDLPALLPEVAGQRPVHHRPHDVPDVGDGEAEGRGLLPVGDDLQLRLPQLEGGPDGAELLRLRREIPIRP